MSIFYIVQRTFYSDSRSKDAFLWQCDDQRLGTELMESMLASFPELDRVEPSGIAVRLLLVPENEIGSGYLFAWERLWHTLQHDIISQWDGAGGPDMLAAEIAARCEVDPNTAKLFAFCFYCSETMRYEKVLQSFVDSKISRGVELPRSEKNDTAFYLSAVGKETGSILSSGIGDLLEATERLFDSVDSYLYPTSPNHKVVASDPQLLTEFTRSDAGECRHLCERLVGAAKAAKPRLHPFAMALFEIVQIGYLVALNEYLEKVYRMASTFFDAVTDAKGEGEIDEDHEAYPQDDFDEKQVLEGVIAEISDLRGCLPFTGIWDEKPETALDLVNEFIRRSSREDHTNDQGDGARDDEGGDGQNDLGLPNQLPLEPGAAVTIDPATRTLTAGAKTFQFKQAPGQFRAIQALYNASAPLTDGPLKMKAKDPNSGDTEDVNASRNLKHVLHKYPALSVILKDPTRNGGVGAGWMLLKEVPRNS